MSVLVLDYLERQLPTPSLHDAAKEVWEAFESLWDAGVLHGDIHAENIVVRDSVVPSSGKRYEVTILDLGMAQCFPGAVPNSERDGDGARLAECVGLPS